MIRIYTRYYISSFTYQPITEPINKITQLKELLSFKNMTQLSYNATQFLSLLQKGQHLTPIQLNDILIGFQYSKLKNSLNQTSYKYQNIMKVLEKLCIEEIINAQNRSNDICHKDLSQISSLVYSSRQLQFKSIIEQALKLFNKPEIFQLIQDNRDINTSIDILYFISTVDQDKSKDLEKIVSQQILSTCKQIKSIVQIDRYSHLFSLVQKIYSSRQNDTYVNLSNTLIKLFNQASNQTIKQNLSNKDLVTILTSFVKEVKTVLQDDHKEFLKKILLILTNHELQLPGLQLMILIFDIVQILKFESLSEKDSIKMIALTLVEKIRNVIITEIIDDKYKIQITYHIFYRIKEYNPYSYQQLENILFHIDLSKLDNLDLIQYLFCLRRFQKPSKTYMTQFEMIYQELIKRNKTSRFDERLRERTKLFLENQLKFYTVANGRNTSSLLENHLVILNKTFQNLSQ